MKKIITLPDVVAVKNFVKAAGESDDIVLVAKVGYTYQVDGSSFLGMMSLMGAPIVVECAGASDNLLSLMEIYTIAC